MSQVIWEAQNEFQMKSLQLLEKKMYITFKCKWLHLSKSRKDALSLWSALLNKNKGPRWFQGTFAPVFSILEVLDVL